MTRPHVRFQPSHIFYVFVVGIIITSVFWIARGTPEAAYLQALQGQTIFVAGRIADDPDVAGSETSLRLTDLSLGDTGQPVQIAGSIYVKLSTPSSPLERDMRLELRGKLSAGFGPYLGYLSRPQLVQTYQSDLRNPALTFRDWFGSLIKQHIDSPEVDLSLGYLLGQRRALPSDLVDTLKFVGLTHIVVASGYNLSVLVNLARRSFGRLSRFAALLGSSALIICFIALTGLSPSMSRAGLVAGLSLLAWYVGRRFHPIKLLLLAAAITLLVNPYYLYDLGWLLSFASFAGVMIVGPLVTRYLYRSQEPGLLAATVVETFSAQLVCLPILIYNFGYISVISIIPNALVLPTIPTTMALTALTGLSAWIPPLAHTLGGLAELLLHYHLIVIDFFGSLQWSIADFTPQNLALLLGLIAAIVAICLYLHRVTHHSFSPRYRCQFTPIYGIISTYEDP
jgi:competence protein ComEC